MFDTLLESRTAVRGPRAGGRRGAVVSVLLHAALIAGAVAATGRAAIVRREAAPRPLIYVAPPPPAERTLPARRSPARGAGGPVLGAPTQRTASTAPGPTLAIPSIAVDVPDLAPQTPAVPADEFARGGLRGAVGAGTSGGLGSGDGPWDAAAVDRAVVPRSGNPAPRYPDALREAGAEGQVVVRFVVDTAGRVEGGSVRVVRADDPRFADAVRAVLPALRFTPAEAGGRRVRQLVEVPFAFAMRR